jgi:hypothetical protein
MRYRAYNLLLARSRI